MGKSSIPPFAFQLGRVLVAKRRSRVLDLAIALPARSQVSSELQITLLAACLFGGLLREARYVDLRAVRLGAHRDCFAR